ncbi:Cap protein [Porcine associated porprismacovirus 4]|uniref:Cap protein n=1 Tax=Porcine associated porprismacovirus 4 TaxID=2170120 RepID=A0A076VFA2_9VIRU|nr:Cap protein [Porcine associated porprismacovirus 4]AIK28865.1 Cap protein [Porcine associated porprismacovirus 4]
MVMVRVSETYDLSTKVGKMGIVGIHTPKGNLITRHYGGLIQNFKYAKFVSCDVALACASMLPADPLQIGQEAGAIAPQDMFNPILYRAVSNESMNNFLAFLQSGAILNGAVDKNSVIDLNNTSFTFNEAEVDQFQLYYGLLSNSDGWKKAMPQAGLEMRGLYPLVFSVNVNTAMPSANGIGKQFDSEFTGLSNTEASPAKVGTVQWMRGGAVRMPRFPTIRFGTNEQYYLIGDVAGKSDLSDMSMNAYVAMIVLPPAKLNQPYYRLKVTWTVEFSEIRSQADILNWHSLAAIGDVSCGTDYAAQSKAMARTEGMVDTNGADVTKVMDGI